MLKDNRLASVAHGIYERGFTFLGFLLMLLAFAFTGSIPADFRQTASRALTEEKSEQSNKDLDAWRAEGTQWLSHKAEEVAVSLRDSGIRHVTVYNRMKSTESALEKASKRGIQITDLKDLYGMRIVVDNELDVYQCLNHICDTYPVVPGTLKNYIVAPKASGYQSVHVVTEIEDRRVEFQLRTEAMHLQAEAEHEAYKARMRNA